MAKGDEYLSFEEVLQELQVNRSRLNQYIRDGRLREHIVGGETKFRRVEVDDIKKVIEKSPTVVEEPKRGAEPPTEMLDEETPVPTARGSAPETTVMLGGAKGEGRGTLILEEDEEGAPETLILDGSKEPDTDLVDQKDRPPTAFVERETEILEGRAGAGYEATAVEDERKPLAAQPSPSESAMETDLELAGAGAASSELAEEDFFDLSDELLEPSEEAGPGREVKTDDIDLGGVVGEMEVPEEDLLSEIMDIQEEQAAAAFPREPETDDITAEITTLEEPTFEESQLGEVLEETAPMEVEEAVGEPAEFAVPYAAEPIMMIEQPMGKWPAIVLCAALVVLLVGALFVVENAVRPEFGTPLTSWIGR